MAGKGSSSSSQRPSSSSSQKKSRWESNNPPPPDPKPPSSTSPAGPSSKPPLDHLNPPASHPPPASTSPFPFPDPSLPPSYGFHMLERRTIVLADGSVRSYFALPPDSPVDPHPDKFFPYGPPGAGHGIEPGALGFGFERNFPPPPGRLSPDALRREREREEFFGRGGPHDHWNPLDGRGPPRPGPESSLKRKYGEEEGRDARDARDEFARQRQQLLQYGNLNPNGFPSGDRSGSPLRRDLLEPGRRGMDDLRPLKHSRSGADGYDDLPSSRLSDVAGGSETKHLDVDQSGLKRAFLQYMKSLNENITQRKNYLEDGKHGVLRCLVCDRDSKEYTDVHGLIMHAYNSQNARVEHLGFHKALCVLMGWNFMRAPDNSKAYQSLAGDEAAANKEDLIIWPPTVIIHNTNTGKKKGRMEGMGNKEMDGKLKELGFGGGKSKSIYGKDGHMGITVVKFASSLSGMEEAERLTEYFEKDNHGRKGWARVQASYAGDDDMNNPYLVKVDAKTGEKKRLLYGYLLTALDLDKVDFDTRKRALIKSKRELDLP